MQQMRVSLTRLTHLSGWNAGAIPAAAICFGTKSMQSNWGWRIPLIIQAFPAFVVCCLVWFLVSDRSDDCVPLD